jgi:CBS domain-containing protein
MRAAVQVLPAMLTRAQILAALARDGSMRRLYYVVDEDNRLVGVVTHRDLETWATGRSLDEDAPPSARAAAVRVRTATTLGEIARRPVLAHAGEPLRAAVHRMAKSGRTHLPVVGAAGLHELVGEITLEDMLKARVRHLEEEQRREGVLPLSAVLPRWLVQGARREGRG